MNINREWLKKNNNWIMLIFGIILIFSGYVSWGILTISYKAPIFKTIGVLFTYMTVVLYNILVAIVVKAKDYKTIQQLWVLSCIGLILCLLLVFNGASNSVLILGWIIAFGAEFIYGVLLKEKYIFEKQNLHKYIGLTLLLLLTCVLAYDEDAVQFKWDGLLYYITCNDLDISSLSSLAIYGHIAQTYGMLIGIGNLIVGNTTIVMIGLNVLLMLCSICGFYAVIKEIVPNKNESQYIITTAIYAWSPFLLGMVHYHSLDFYCQCLFTLVLYTLYKRKWIYFSVFSLLFCFTKEPAIVIYAAMCAGMVIVDFINDSKFSLTVKVQRLFRRKKYYLMVVPGILWLVTYNILGPWSAGAGGFSIDKEYILNKLQNLYVLNFNWVFALLAIGGSIYILRKKQWSMMQWLIPLWCSQLAFTLFSCLFNTVNHSRYNDTNQITLYLLALIPLLYYCTKIKCWGMMLVLCIACLSSSFVTLDPLTKICYGTMNIGTTTMIYTAGDPLGDGMIYNRQMLGLESVLNMALNDALEDGDVILFPTINNNAYAFDGMATVGVIQDAYMVELENWDSMKKARSVYENDNTKTFRTYQLTDRIDWSELEQDLPEKVNYIFVPSIDEEYSEYIMKHYSVIEEEQYEHRGWILKRICFKVEV